MVSHSGPMLMITETYSALATETMLLFFWMMPVALMLGAPCSTCCGCTVTTVLNFGAANPETSIWGWQDTTLNPGPFYASAAPITSGNVPLSLPVNIHFGYRDSLGCPSNNRFDPGRQSGKVECTFSLDEQTTVFVSISGRVEAARTGYDTARLSIDGVERAYIQSFFSGFGCAMSDISDTDQIVLSAGEHTYTLEVDTIDEGSHRFMHHLFEISVLP